MQARQAELEGLQASLTADADALSQQLSTFEARREDAVRELQVQSQCRCTVSWTLGSMQGTGLLCWPRCLLHEAATTLTSFMCLALEGNLASGCHHRCPAAAGA